MDHRTMGAYCKNHCTDFMVKWKGMPYSEATWVRDVIYGNLKMC